MLTRSHDIAVYCKTVNAGKRKFVTYTKILIKTKENLLMSQMAASRVTFLESAIPINKRE